MLYLDMSLPIQPLDRKAHPDNRGIILGRSLRNRRRVRALKVPRQLKGQQTIRAGLHFELTITSNRQEPCRIIVDPSDEQYLFMILTTQLTPDLDYVGNLRVPRSQTVHLIDQASAPPNEGHWQRFVLRASRGDAFFVNWNLPDGTAGTNCLYYVDKSGEVYACPEEGIPDLFEYLGAAPPFTVRDDPDPRVSRLDRREWRKL